MDAANGFDTIDGAIMTKTDGVTAEIVGDNSATLQSIDVSKTRIGKDEAVGTSANQMQGVSFRTTKKSSSAIETMKKNGMKFKNSKQGVFYS